MQRVIKKIISFLKSRFVDQKKFILLHLRTKDFKNYFVKNDENLRVFLANSSHQAAIENDLFPHFDEQQDYFKQFLNFDPPHPLPPTG